MLAQRLPGLLLSMQEDETLESGMVQSLGSGGWRARPGGSVLTGASITRLAGGLWWVGTVTRALGESV